MRKLLSLFAVLALCSLASAQVPMTGAGLPKPAAAATGYQGPGDIVSSALMWGSCARAYTATFAATLGAICDVVDSATGLTTCTFHIQASGFVSPTECNGSACAVACKVTKLYDQTGSGNHWTNGTLASMPTLTFSALGGLPGMTCTSAANTVLTGGTPNQAIPYAYSGVGERTSTFTTAQFLIGASGADDGFGWAVSTNAARLSSGGSAINATASDSAFHSFNGTVNGASGGINVDGTDSGNANAGSVTTSGTIRICRNQGAVSTNGVVMEAGMWPLAISQTNRGNISTNQHSLANGYNF